LKDQDFLQNKINVFTIVGDFIMEFLLGCKNLKKLKCIEMFMQDVFSLATVCPEIHG
jgi:hypothetical protein